MASPLWWSKLKRVLTTYALLICGILARVLFIAHATVSTFIAASIHQGIYINLLFLPIGFLLIESFVTLHWRENKEWKWFTLSIAFYLLATVPSIWVMETLSFEDRAEAIRNNETYVLPDCNMAGVISSLESTNLTNFNRVGDDVAEFCKCGVCLPIMEQMLLLLMIVGRWILPSQLTSDQKAQLLLVNIAVASDLLDLYEMMKEDNVKNNFVVVIVILTIWSASLLQFAMVSTAVADRSSNACECFKTEIWSLITLLLLDDAPFLTLRLVCIIKFKVLSYSSLFFTCKNALVLLLDINRLIALSIEVKKSTLEQRCTVMNHEMYLEKSDMNEEEKSLEREALFQSMATTRAPTHIRR